MADNFETSPPDPGGATFAADDIAGVFYARTKISWGIDGAAVDASMTDPFPIQAGTGVTIPVSLAAVSSFNLGQYGGSAVGAGNALHVQPGTGATWASTQSGSWTVTIQDGGNTITVDNAGTFAVQAAQSGSWNIGTVTAVTTVGTITNVVHVDDNGGSLTVDNGGTFAVQATVAASATNIAKAEDAASASADVGVPAMAIRKAAPANTSDLDGDYEMLQMSAGRLWVDASGTTLTVASHEVTNAGTFAVQAAQSGTWTVTGAGGTFPVTDSGGSLTVDGTVTVQDGGGSITVDGTVTANAGTGTFTVGDGGGSLTVDGTVAATQSGTWTVTGAGGTFPVTDSGGSLTVDNNGTFAVQATIAAGATSIAKAEDVASADADVGVPAMAIRKATPANTSSLDGDYEMLQMSAGRLWVDASGVSLTVGTHAVTQSGTWTVTGAGGTFPVTDSGGSLTVDDGGSSLTVDGAVTVSGTVAATQSGTWNVGTVTTVSTVSSVSAITPGTGATNLGKAEDAAHVTGDVGVMGLAVRSDTAASLSGTTGDYQPLITNATGHLWVDASGQTLTVGTHAVTQSGTWTVTGTGGTFPVTDSGGSLTVDDGGGSLTVDGTVTVTGTVAATQSGTWNVGTVTTVTTVGTVSSVSAITPGTGATNLGKAEDAAHTTGDTGVMALGVRSDTAASLAGTTGDYQPFITNATGHLWVDASGQTLTVGTHAVTQSGTWTVTGTGGTFPVTDSGGSLTVDNGGTFAVQSTSVVPGTGATNLGKAEDAAHTTGDTGVMALGVRSDTAASLAGTTGDYQPFITNATGHLWVDASGQTLTVATHAVTQSGAWTVTANAGTGTFTVGDGGGSLTVDNAGTFAVQAAQSGTWNIGTVTPGTAATNLGKAEDAAHTTGDVGVMALAVRNDIPTILAGTDGDYIPLSTDASGSLRTNPGIVGVTSNVSGNFLAEVYQGGTWNIDTITNPVSALQTGLWDIGTVTTVTSITNTVNVGGTVSVEANATSIGKAEDVASANADVGVPAMAVRKATPANTSGTDGDYEMLQMSAGRLWTSATIDAALPTGTNTIGKVSTVSTSTNADGWTTHRTILAASNNATVVKASAGILAGLQLGNSSSARIWVKIYDKATTPSSADTPIKTIQCENAALIDIAFAPPGINCASGISYRVTAGCADSDTTNVTTPAAPLGSVLNIDYK